MHEPVFANANLFRNRAQGRGERRLLLELFVRESQLAAVVVRRGKVEFLSQTAPTMPPNHVPVLENQPPNLGQSGRGAEIPEKPASISTLLTDAAGIDMEIWPLPVENAVAVLAGARLEESAFPRVPGYPKFPQRPYIKRKNQPRKNYHLASHFGGGLPSAA